MKIQSALVICGAFLCGAPLLRAQVQTAAPNAASPAEVQLLRDPQVIARSLVSAGDTARLQRVFAKARRGERITVVALGGSITEGARATRPENRYANLIGDWWRRTFPKADIVFVNAGIGATGSNYGSLRAQRDVLSKKPDFVVLDYAVNDRPTKDTSESFEGLVRQILNDPGKPAVALLFMSRPDGTNAQEWEAKVGEHYKLPMVSYRDAVYPEVAAGRVRWATLGPDVHPNDFGHGYTASLVISMLEKALAAGGPTEVQATLPAPIYSDLFEHTVLQEASDLHPVRNEGWTYDAGKRGWISSQPGSIIEFNVAGAMLLFMDYHIHGPMGKARIQVDDRPPTVRDGWFDLTWGGYRDTLLLGRDMAPGEHRIRVELLEDKNPQSEGHEYRILGLGGVGGSAQPPVH